MKRLIARATVATAIAATVLPSPAFGQANAPKPISRADFVKTVDNRFTAIDTNRDGKVGKNELMATQQRELQTGRQRIAEQLRVKFRQLDTNKDGQLSQAEFLVVAPTIRTTETADQLLAKLDANKNGTVSADEFRAPELAKFNKADANRDGVVTPAEMRAAAGKK